MEPGHGKAVRRKGLDGVESAYTWRGVIHLYPQLLQQNNTDVEALTVHELTHVVQDNYTLWLNCTGIQAVTCFFKKQFGDRDRGMRWASEAINDYVAFRLFRRRLEPVLRLDGDGRLRGYNDGVPLLRDLEKMNLPIGNKGYEISYAVAASFLLWLEETRDPEIIRKLNRAFSEHRCSRKLFQQWCGDTVDRRWLEFLAASTGRAHGGSQAAR
jgi:hypothetical protein